MPPRFLIFASFILLIFFSCSSGKNQNQQKKLRVMTYNIHYANPPSQLDSIDIAAIVKAIGSQNPDLVALQEVDVNTARSGEGNQAEMIAEKLGMHSYFGKALDFSGGEYGTAILSKFPISDTITYLLPDLGGPGSEQRVLTTAKVELPSGAKVVFASAHLDHRGDPESRMLQVREILNIIGEANIPWILAGDLNSYPDSEEIQLLETRFDFSCKDCPFTFPADHPDRTLDYIAFYPKGEVVAESHLVVEETYASDHRPVFAVLRILK